MPMKEMKQYFFIINPISGKGKGKKLIPLIEKFFSERNLIFEIHITTFAGEAKSLASIGIQKGYTTIIAVGGDGTVNEVGAVLVNSSVHFGIIPIGSGNGLARELKIPMDPYAAIKNLIKGDLRKIDSGTCNGHYFACTAGIGFDAKMSSTFLHLTNRGLNGYVRTFLKEFFKYKSLRYEFQLNEKKIEVDALLITIANCKQWGNEFYISPQSKANDGLLEICILKKFPIYVLPFLLFRAVNKTLNKSKYITISKITSIQLKSSETTQFHTDGEVLAPHNLFQINVNPNSLTIISGF